MKKYFIILVLLALAIFISGCIGLLTTPGDDSIAPGRGRLEIYLTDEPGDYKEVNIIISKIQGHIVGKGDNDWDVLRKWKIGTEPTFDLIELKDKFILLTSLELEPNKYTQLRLFLKDDEDEDNAWLILDDGTKKPLVIPSVYQTGIKLIHPFEIVEGEITELTIDFDAGESVVKTDNGEYILKPVIKVTSETFSFGDFPEGLGSVSGSVVDSGSMEIVGASVSLSGGEYIFANTTTTSEGGSFSLNNVPVGSYTLNVNAGGFYDYSDNIVVEGNQEKFVDIVLTRIPQP